jgi:Protein of unknown function, DUF481
MVRVALAAVCSLALAGSALGQSPFTVPQPLGGPIVNQNGQTLTGMDAHPQQSSWSGGLDAGLSGSQGNTDTFMLRVGFDLKYDDPSDFAILNVLYILDQANSTQFENKAFGLFRNELPVASGLAWYAQVMLEYDDSLVDHLRIGSYSGLSYALIQDGTQTLKLRAGGGAAREYGSPDNAWFPQAQAGADYEYKLSDKTTFSVAGDYYPDLETFGNYWLRGRASFDILLDQQSNIMLRLGVFDRYDSRPNGGKYNDIEYFAMLSFRF